MEKTKKESFSCIRGNMIIRGLYFHPEGQNLPIAIVSHGFMANYKTTQGYAKWFAEHGFAAFCFDFNGGCLVGKSDRDTTKMTVFTEVQDLETVISYAKSLPETDKNSLTLMGCSQGGVVSALTAAKLQRQVKNLILFYPALCIPDDARAGKMMFAKFDPRNIPETFSCGPMKLGRDYAASVLNLDIIGEIRKYPGSVLIVHGTGDKIVDYHYSEKAQAAYPDAVLKLIPGGSHGFSKKDDKNALEYVEQFIGKQRG
ncbi:MAG: alpha/beta hydrolase [Lachnospiraceae bacterium]|nr:alpha/beta hydrolase [Lachnospiraceae bacterium]